MEELESKKSEYLMFVNFGYFNFPSNLEGSPNITFQIEADKSKCIHILLIKDKVHIGDMNIETLNFEPLGHLRNNSKLSAEFGKEFKRFILTTERFGKILYDDVCDLYERINQETIKRRLEIPRTDVTFNFSVNVTSKEYFSKEFLEQISSNIQELIYSNLSVDDADATELFDFEECDLLRTIETFSLDSEVKINN